MCFTKKNKQELSILGITITDYNNRELLCQIKSFVEKKKKATIASGNVQSFNIAFNNSWYKEFLNNADIIRNDSAGLCLAARILDGKLTSRMTWADFGWDLASYCEKEGLTQYFLGNKPGIAEKAKSCLKEKYPGLKILGTHHGYFNKEGKENQIVLDKINALKPDILIVGMGMPLQEKWVLENQDKLDVGVIMTGGNCFSFLAGEESRAPDWMHKNGLEWLYRFIKEPIRMFKRYIIGNPIFIYRVIIQKIANK